MRVKGCLRCLPEVFQVSDSFHLPFSIRFGWGLKRGSVRDKSEGLFALSPGTVSSK